MLKKIQKLLTDSCILFTLLVFILYSIGNIFLDSGNPMTLDKLPLLFLTCLLFCLCHRILYVKQLHMVARVLLHYVAVLAAMFVVFAVFTDIISTSLQSLIMLSIITLLYSVIALVYTFWNTRSGKKAKEEYSPMFKK